MAVQQPVTPLRQYAALNALPLFRVGQTVIAVHVSFFGLVVLAAVLGLAQYGGVPGAVFYAIAVVLVFGCVLIHELAHSAVARRYGIETHDILLTPVGGVANIDVALLKPRDEIRIALAGPFVNLLVGTVLSLMVAVAAVADRSSLVEFVLNGLRAPSLFGLLTYLAAVNGLLGTFNLLPVFPLDGGRTLRATLSRRLPFDAATRIVTTIGQIGAVALGIIGLVMIIGGVWLYGLALLVVAGFIYDGARAEARSVSTRTALDSVTVGELARPPRFLAAPHDTISALVPMIVGGDSIPVVIEDTARLVGIVTRGDLLSAIRRKVNVSAAHIMRTHMQTVRPTDPLWIAYEKMKRSSLYAIPVMDHDQFQGVITLADIQRRLNGARE